MKTIAIDARIISSGTGRYIERLITHLEQLDSPHQYIVLVRAKDKDYWKPSKANFRVEVADFADYTFAEQLGFLKLLNKLKPDLVHFCMPQQPVLYKGATVTTVHDLNLVRITGTDDMNPLVFKLKQNIFKWLLKRVSQTSKEIISISEYSKHDLVAFSDIPEEKVTVTYEAADTKATGMTPIKHLEGKSFIMYLGRAEPYKNNRGLMKAHQLLLSKFPDLELLIVGKKDEFRKMDEAWAIEEQFKNITFTGFVSDEQQAWLYANCKAYVFPSFMEGFGLPALEAMVYGAPVVSSDATCLPEIYGDAALYFDAHNPTDIAKAIESVLTDEKLAKELGEKAKQHVKKYSWAKMAKETLTVYERALQD